MAGEPEDAPIHRLVDMEVEEVSLVDRAANKRRFLVVKRSESMGQQGGSEGSHGTSDGEGEADSDGQDGGATDDRASGGASPLTTAASALEGLTDVITQLGAAGDDAQRNGIDTVVQGLRSAADSLEQALSDGSDDDEGDDEGEDAPAPSTGTGRSDAAGGQLGALVGAVTELVTELRAAKGAKPAAKAASRSSNQSNDDDDEDERGENRARNAAASRRVPKLKSGNVEREHQADRQPGGDSLQTTLKAFTDALQEHGRRLSKLEKRTSAPTSRPPGERPAPTTRTNDERAWPLDLNAAQSA